jgi:hypothetical protein
MNPKRSLLCVSQLLDQKGIYTVQDFLEELLFGGAGTATGASQKGSADPRCGSFAPLLRAVGTAQNAPLLRGVMNLVQFVKITYLPTASDLTDFFSRGLGVIAPADQSAYNLYLPVVLDVDVNPANRESATPTQWDAAADKLTPQRETITSAAAVGDGVPEQLGPRKDDHLSLMIG